MLSFVSFIMKTRRVYTLQTTWQLPDMNAWDSETTTTWRTTWRACSRHSCKKSSTWKLHTEVHHEFATYNLCVIWWLIYIPLQNFIKIKDLYLRQLHKSGHLKLGQKNIGCFRLEKNSCCCSLHNQTQKKFFLMKTDFIW